jgi:hypothetical protein
MTQLSPITLVYDQIALSIANMLKKQAAGDYVTKQDVLEDFNKNLKDIYDKINSPQTSLELFTKSEPPSSTKMNKFINSIRDDINVSAKQLDFLNAKAVSLFNLFTSEIENEKKYSERILSKTKVLQMYSLSPSNDLIYNGDSFENGDYIDWQKVQVNQNPMITNGFASLRIKDRPIKWLPSRININRSNGFIGNNNLAVKKQNDISGINYEYSFVNSPSSSNVNSLIDSNPATYFVYEALRVTPTDDVYRSEEEFSYIVNDASIVNAEQNSLINWADHDINEPLIFDFTIKSNTAQKANSINITPYFDSSKIVKVKEIHLTDLAGNTENILKKEFFIGLSLENLTKESLNNYSLNSAVFFFSERRVKECRIVLEQPYYQDVEILHTYWETNYESANADNSPFYGINRFNPEMIDKDLYTKTIYNKSATVPTLTNPNVFKKDNSLSQNLNVVIKTSNESDSTGLTEENFTIPLKISNEVLPAKRMSIGIRDVALAYQEYELSADIISKPYLFDTPIESLMLDIESNYNEISGSGGYIQSYVSLDGGEKWIEIAPVQYGFTVSKTSNISIPEILAFFQNIAVGFKLPGVQYLNYPKTTINKIEYSVPSQVKNILVKIRIVKGSSNVTPVVYSYKLAAKVKQV